MEHVSMNDGLDGRETVAFGLAAAEVAAFVGTLLAAYAVLCSGLPGAAAWAIALPLATAGAVLAWGHAAGRSFLEWSVLLVRFAVRTRGGAGRAGQGGAVALPLSLRRHTAPRPATEPRGAPITGLGIHPGGRAAPRPDARLETFFSLSGGSGRTTLAVEVALLAAIRLGARRATGAACGRVALLDLAVRSPSVALRLGLPVPPPAPAGAPLPRRDDLTTLPGGLVVFPGPAPAQLGAAAFTWVDRLVALAVDAGAELIVADIDNDLTDVGRALLARCDRVHVTLTATAGGVLDAYRSTAALRRLGLGAELDYVVTRSDGPLDLDEVMGDLRGTVIAVIPQDAGVVAAENDHQAASLRAAAPTREALAHLADEVQRPLDGGGDAAAWGCRAG